MSFRSDAALVDGHYARKQLFCASRVISWSHTRRFELARRLVAPYKGKRLLDYGCGDGTFVAIVSDLFPEATGADIDEGQAADCRLRLGSLARLSFILTQELREVRHNASFDVVVCMETLEHCVDRTLDGVLLDLRRLVAPQGTVIISVPVEIGPSLALKQAMRRIAGWRGLGDYAYNERYSAGELLKMLFATKTTAIQRPTYFARAEDGASAYHGHKGFNWRRLREKLRAHFTVAETRFSPLTWSKGLLSSQAWFICRPN